MKNNQNSVSFETIELLIPVIKSKLLNPDNWNTLDVDYYPPRVERLWLIYGGFRIHLHVIHKTADECLYHKHKWPAAFKQLKGSYMMGVTYHEEEISSDIAHQLPDLMTILVTPGMCYEMTQTDTLHYVKPVSDVSYSIMITKDLYPEAINRKEALNKELLPLDDNRKLELINIFAELLNG